MSDVAVLAGVGTKTVSRVLNGEPNVSAKTTAKVLAAVEELDYQLDLMAGSLRRIDRRTHSIGLLIGALDNPFSTALTNAVEIIAFRRKSVLLSSSLHLDPRREREVVGELLRRRVDGLLLTTATHSLDIVAAAQSRGTVVVYMDGPPLGMTADAVLSDSRSGAILATKHLLDQGHRRIAYIGARRDVYTIRERRMGYEDELRRWGIAPDPALIIEDANEGTAEAAARELAMSGNPPHAIFSGQNLCTIGVIRGLRSAQAQQRIALVGFDDLPMSDLLDPGLTVIAQNPEQIGTRAAERLFQRLDGDVSDASTSLVPVRLIERGSGEIRISG
jgi:DNA-binding LacI/PurR family transcriptional regulator